MLLHPAQPQSGDSLSEYCAPAGRSARSALVLGGSLDNHLGVMPGDAVVPAPDAQQDAMPLASGALVAGDTAPDAQQAAMPLASDALVADDTAPDAQQDAMPLASGALVADDTAPDAQQDAMPLASGALVADTEAQQIKQTIRDLKRTIAEATKVIARASKRVDQQQLDRLQRETRTREACAARTRKNKKPKTMVEQREQRSFWHAPPQGLAQRVCSVLDHIASSVPQPVDDEA